MGVYEQQMQALAKHYDPEMRKIEENGNEANSSVVSGNDEQAYEWANVLRELDPYY